MCCEQAGNNLSPRCRSSSTRRKRTRCQLFDGFCQGAVAQATFGGQHLVVNRFPHQGMTKLISLSLMVEPTGRSTCLAHFTNQLDAHGSPQYLHEVALVHSA